MATRGIDLYLTSGPENVFYLSGQQTPGYYTFQCLAIPAAGEPFHVLRGLESMNARANTYLADISGYPDDANPAAAVAQVLAEHGWKGKRVAIDQNAWFLTVNLETSACYNRYHAALYRTVAIGRIPDRARDMYRVCEEGLAAAMAELRPGRTCADVHQAAQGVIDRHGYTFGYRKRTGYSIGI